MARLEFLRKFATEGRHYDGDHEIIDTIKNDPTYWNVSSLIRNDPGIKEHHLTAAMDHPAWQVRDHVLGHPLATHEHIMKGIHDKDDRVLHAAINSPNAEPEHHDAAIKRINSSEMDQYNSQYARTLVSVKPNLSSKQISDLYDPDHAISQRYLAMQTNLPKDVHTKLINSTEASVKVAALRHPLTTDDQIHAATHDPSELVRLSANIILDNRSLRKNPK